jgi:hypothetical protein
LSPDARRLFVELAGGWEVVGRGRWLVVYRLGRFTRGSDLKARNFDTTIDTAARIVTALTGR